jgi:small-conductance mechanosensitive channel
MEKNKKDKIRKRALMLLVALDYFVLSRIWALIVLLIACVPVRDNWHIYCLAFGVPILLFSLVAGVIMAMKKEGEDFDIDIIVTDIEERDTKFERHE